MSSCSELKDALSRWQQSKEAPPAKLGIIRGKAPGARQTTVTRQRHCSTCSSTALSYRSIAQPVPLRITAVPPGHDRVPLGHGGAHMPWAKLAQRICQKSTRPKATPARPHRSPMVPPVKSLDIVLDQMDYTYFLNPTAETWITGSVWVCLYDPNASAIQRAWIQAYGAGTNRWTSKTSDKIYEHHAVYYDRVVQLQEMRCSAYVTAHAQNAQSSSDLAPSSSRYTYFAPFEVDSGGDAIEPDPARCIQPRANGLMSSSTDHTNGYQALVPGGPCTDDDGCCCQFPFRLPLPPEIPSSYACEYGSCNYKLIVTVLLLDSVCGVCEVSVSKTFRVVAAVNLSLHAPLLTAHAKYPLRIHDTREYDCCCCFACGAMMCSLHLEKSGYIMGETIWAHIYLNNQSKRTIRQIRVQLVQKYKFYAASRYEGAPDYKETQTVVAEVALTGLRVTRGKTSLKQPLNVPKSETDTIPYHSGPSLEVKHAFRLIVKPGIKLELPIFLGTCESGRARQADETQL